MINPVGTTEHRLHPRLSSPTLTLSTSPSTIKVSLTGNSEEEINIEKKRIYFGIDDEFPVIETYACQFNSIPGILYIWKNYITFEYSKKGSKKVCNYFSLF